MQSRAGKKIASGLEMFYLNYTLNFGIPPVLVFQLEVYYKVDRLLNVLTAQQKGTTARWYSNKTSLLTNNHMGIVDRIKDIFMKDHCSVY